MRTLSIATALLAVIPFGTPAEGAERRFSATGFDAVTLSGSDRVVVTTGSVASVVASGDPDAIAALRIGTRGGTLHIDRLPRSYHDRGAIVTVTVPRLSKVTLDGSGSIRARGVAGPRFAANGNGSGNIVVEELRAAETRLSLAGSGSVVATGSSAQLWIDASGSGSVDTSQLAARDVDVTSSGSSSVRAHASGRAAINGSGSGPVSVDGAADCRVSKSGSGSIRCRQAS